MNSQDIRRSFLHFFKEQGHAIVSSSSVVPHEDPTLLFINAGMNQFKDVFLGKSARDYTRAATAQKCIRVGGKHNDLDNVGHTTRHLTLFEMLGNFSFGDYFKQDAIAFAWKVSTEIFQFAPEHIWVTVFEEDDEAFELWQKWIPTSRLVRMGEKDNFWSMGDTGPCGPCSELLFDRGNRYGTARNPKEDLSGERFLEFWNLVFMQFNKSADGKTQLLPNKSIDTGAGLERLISLKMGVDTVFATDIFQELIAEVSNLASVAYDPNDAQKAPAFHVIADHIRSLAFAMADGAQPSNTERGYVLRKILRRAVRYGKGLGFQEPFLAKVLPRLVATMGEDYPELRSSQDKIAELLTLEEEAFFRTLRRGGNILGQIIDKSKATDKKQIEGEDAFKLKDTYGLPLEEILLIAKDAGLQVNLEAYQILEELAKEKSRASDSKQQQVGESSQYKAFLEKHEACTFVGYAKTECEASVLAILCEGAFVDSLTEGQEAILLLNKTPFYAEKGGQVGDTGMITHRGAEFIVKDCQSPYPGVIAHIGCLHKGALIPGEPVIAQVDQGRRKKISQNHTATHLLHAALQHVLGAHVRQAGSIVDPLRLRFDFTHHKAISKEELRLIEKWVSRRIQEGGEVKTYEIPYEEAQKHQEIKQFFGEKYGASVRVVDITHSKELCGGTHTSQLGTVGLFRIAKEGSIAAGVRRIEAITGEEAENFLYEQEEQLDRCCSLLKATPSSLAEKVQELLEENKAHAALIKRLRRQAISAYARQFSKEEEFLCLQEIVPFTAEELPLLADDLSNERSSFFLVLAAVDQESCHLFIKISKDLQARGLHAGQLIKEIAPAIQGNGGGKPESAQAGGKHPEGIQEAFSLARSKITSLC
ncbi:MAG: alanine--tRNA ligase [Chlamydiae bacterium]|nr:alanine--tRNA ligase [Chlamydiota bacterium]